MKMLLLLLLPLSLAAQTVSVPAPEYRRLVRQDTILRRMGGPEAILFVLNVKDARIRQADSTIAVLHKTIQELGVIPRRQGQPVVIEQPAGRPPRRGWWALGGTGLGLLLSLALLR